MRSIYDIMLTTTIRAHAKINLSLDVLYRRVDGYHELESIMQSLALHDLVTLTANPDAEVRTLNPTQLIRVTVDNPEVPSDEENIAFNAAKILMRRSGNYMPLQIAIAKNIPVEAGLAGGSSNAAAALWGLNQLWKLGLTPAELGEIGQKIGADVPFCLQGGTALVGGIGEKVTSVPSKCKDFGVILVKPTFGISTAEVYRSLDLKKVVHPNTLEILDAVVAGDLAGICANLGNVLESVTLPQYQTLVEIKEALLQAGAQGVLQTGSGPTIFGLTSDLEQAQGIAKKLEGKYPTVIATTFWGKGQETA